MKLRSICLSVFGVIFISLVMLMNGLCSIIEAAESDDVLEIYGLDPTDMSEYYAMGEYYPPDTVDTLNVNWVGGRVEIVAYDETSYFVEEAATRQLREDERLSYFLDGNTFSIFYVESDETVIDDAFKKVEIRIPRERAQNLKSINVNTNGEVVFKNLIAENITVNNVNSEVRFENVYSKNTVVETDGGNVGLKVNNNTGYSVDFESKTGTLTSYVGESLNSYVSGSGTYPFTVITVKGNLDVSLIEGY